MGFNSAFKELNTQSRFRSHLQRDTSLALRSLHRMLQIQEWS